MELSWLSDFKWPAWSASSSPTFRLLEDALTLAATKLDNAAATLAELALALSELELAYAVAEAFCSDDALASATSSLLDASVLSPLIFTAQKSLSSACS